MPRKTLALISGLVVVTIILFVIALRAGQQQLAPNSSKTSPMASQPTPVIPAHTTLALAPNPLTVTPGRLETVNITMDTSDNKVTAVQLELGYDPTIISNVKVTPGPLFANPVVLINKNHPTTGRYTYAFGITPSNEPVNGKGVVATISFIANATALGKDTQIGLLPSSLVTARGVAQSVLKSTTGTVVTVGTGTSSTGTTGAGSTGGTNPKVSCTSRPACLDATPRCLIAEPANGWCPK